jgi:hypothetical protein
MIKASGYFRQPTALFPERFALPVDAVPIQKKIFTAVAGIHLETKPCLFQ